MKQFLLFFSPGQVFVRDRKNFAWEVFFQMPILVNLKILIMMWRSEGPILGKCLALLSYHSMVLVFRL